MALSAHLRLTDANAAVLRASGRVVVVGATGWLGSAALAMLDRALPGPAFEQRVAVFGSRERTVALPSGRQAACHDLDAMGDLADAVVLHFAYLTKDRAAAMDAAGYGAANDAIQHRVAAAVRAGRPRGLFFASSGAVYGAAGPGAPTDDRQLYGRAKLRHEDLFAAAAAASGCAFLNGRIFSLAGEGINKVDLYALASILVALRAGEPVRLLARREVWRSYAYVGDVINLALALLLARRSEPCLDIAGAEPIEIGALARLCAEVTGRSDAAVLRPPPLAGEAPDRMVGDAAPFLRLLERENVAALPLREQVRATATFLGAA